MNSVIVARLAQSQQGIIAHYVSVQVNGRITEDRLFNHVQFKES